MATRASRVHACPRASSSAASAAATPSNRSSTLIRISPPTISGGRSELGGTNWHDRTHRYRDLGGSHARNPGFRGHPRPAEDLFDYLKNGDTLADFLDDFPTVSHEQAVKVLELAEEDLIDAAVAGRVVAKEAQSSPRAS